MEVPIRVVARVKPCLPEEGTERCIQVAPAASQIVLGFDNFCDFDAVFGENVSQKELYNTCLADMVTNFFQGFNTTVISYGQQGSGKTYTMTGPDFLWAMNEEEFGLVPQAVRHIFKMMNEIPEREYRVHISYLIVHQEAVYDLLASGQPLSPLNVLEDNLGNVVIPGLTVVDCSNISEVLNCLEAGLLHRHSASSQGFDLSSAHTMFNFTLEHQWSDPEGRMKYLYSRISFVDLAGTEERRLSLNYNDIGGVSNSVKNNLLLNSDLKTLANVLQCLVNKNYRGVIPYRESRLTHILKESFGGNSITLMICCLSPLSKDYNASFETLKVGSLTRYAVNFPSPNVVLQNSMQSLISTHLPSNLTNVWSSRQSNGTGNLSSTSLSHNSMLKSANTPQQQQQQQQQQQHQPPPPPSAPFLLNTSYQTYQQQPVMNGINYHSFRNIDDLSLHDNDFIFKVQFAASQWHLLVSSAEDLLASILQSGSVSPSDKSKIQSWLCMKAEADECIGTDVPPLQPEAEGSRPLEVIEELSEPNDVVEESQASCRSESEISSSVSSLGEEFYSQLESLREKFFVLTSNFIREAETQYIACNKVCETLSQRNSVEDNTENVPGTKDLPMEKMSVSETSSLSSMSRSDKSSIEEDKIDRKKTEEKEGNLYAPLNDIPLNNSQAISSNGKDKFQTSVENQVNYDSDKENLASNFGSRLSLLSKTSSTSSNGNKILKKKKTRMSKKSERMVDKFRRMSSIGKGSGWRDSKLRRNSGPALQDDSCSSSGHVNIYGKETEGEEDGIGASSERELLRKVSSKIVSVSKGPSKCVNNLKTKSFQLKRSIRSHIFRKKSKTIQHQESPLIEQCKTSQSIDLPCSVRLVSDDLKVARNRLEELNATIKVKEAFIHELKMSVNEAETTRKKCESQMELLEEELEALKKKHYNIESKMTEETDEDEKAHYRNKTLEYKRKISLLKKKISRLDKVASISTNDVLKVKELEKSIQELRAEQEELHTKLREEMQRKEQLEQQIQRENRCARNPLCSSSKIMDEEDSDREVEMNLNDSLIFPRPESESTDRQYKLVTSKKRKLANSTGDSQSETSMRGSRRGYRDKRKSGRFDKSLSDLKDADEGKPEMIRKEIGLLRNARDNLINRRQKIDKRIRKGRVQGDGREDERKLLEYDEVVEGLDAVIERKNEVISGKIDRVEPEFLLLTKNELEERLNNLPIAELHFLLFKYFSRIVDLRIEFRRQELAFAELENQYDEQGRYITNLKAAYQQASLEMERRVTSLQREYQYKISYLLRHFNDDTSSHGVQEMKFLEMEQQLYYYKKLSKELKDKLREYLSHGSSKPSRECEPVPGPSGIKNHRISTDPMSTFLPHRTDPSPPVTPHAWPRRGRRFAMHSVGVSNTTKVTRQKNKLIIQQNGENKHNS